MAKRKKFSVIVTEDLRREWDLTVMADSEAHAQDLADDFVFWRTSETLRLTRVASDELVLLNGDDHYATPESLQQGIRFYVEEEKQEVQA
jgi:NMD protein affecting ribosome stability and mRNA decay